MRDHQQRHARLGEKLLQPFHHLHIQVVGGLVKNQEIRLMQKYQCQSEAFHLSARKFINTLLQIVQCKTGQVLPRFQVLFFVQIGQQVGNSRSCGIYGKLLQVADFQVVGIGYRPRIGRLLPYQNLQHGGFARSIRGNQRGFVAFLDAKGDISEQSLDSERLGDGID